MKYATTLGLALATFVVVKALAPSQALGSIRLVSNLNDSGPGSLRQAIVDSGDGDRIEVGVAGAITLTSGPLAIARNIGIAGPGAALLTVSANYQSRVFYIVAGEVLISDLTIAKGQAIGADGTGGTGGHLDGYPGGAALGAGVYNEGTLTLSNCAVILHSTIGGTGGTGVGGGLFGPLGSGGAGGLSGGAGLYNNGRLFAVNCTFSDNVVLGGHGGDGADGRGGAGGAGAGAGVYNRSRATLSNCTFGRNSVQGGGGGVGGASFLGGSPGGNGGFAFGGGLASDGTLEVANCTINNNSANGGLGGPGGPGPGGLDGPRGSPGDGLGGGLEASSDPSTTYLINVIVAGNTADHQPDVHSQFISSMGHNLIGQADGSGPWLATDLTGTLAAPLDAALGPLQENGGRTQTQALLPESIAIDNGDDAVLEFLVNDQRGRPRLTGRHVDIGAYEFGSITLTVVNRNDSGAGSLRQTIADALDGDTINFDPNVTGVIGLTSSELAIDRSLTINGPGANVLTVSGNNAYRIFNITRGSVTICGLTIANGNAASYGGGIRNLASLRVCDCLFSRNAAQPPGGFGGGVYNEAGALTVERCTFAGNSANDGGGIANLGALTVINSTFAGNKANTSGGALYHFGYAAILRSCTLSSNEATAAAGGFYSDFCATSPEVGNCLLAGNIAPFSVDGYGPFTSRGYNLIGKADPIFTQGFGLPGDQVGTPAHPIDPKLGPLRDNGGPTPTMALRPGSPALDTGSSGGLTTDQRGRPRPLDNADIADAAGGDGSDIGALEFMNTLRITRVWTVGLVVLISFTTEPGNFYQVEYKGALISGEWATLTLANKVPGTGETVTVFDPGPISAQRFYRVRLLP